MGNSVKKHADSAVVDAPGLEDVRTGTLVGFAAHGEPVVELAEASGPYRVTARSCLQLGLKDVGRTLVLAFDRGDRSMPIVLGVIQTTHPARTVNAEVDGQSVVVHAEQSIVFRCGEASITLDRDGRIVIRGKQVVSHASGANRILGGSVELN